MCGFVVTVGAVEQVETVRGRLGVMAHRGPNESGVVAVDMPWGVVTMGMVRLSLVDHDTVGVPYDFRAPCGVVLAFNGEIYNWRELRAELADGTPWQTDCDAEVIARAWRRWGGGMLSRFNGMFAIVLADVEQGCVFVATDRAGQKPLYWSYPDDHVDRPALLLSSEIKALPRTLEERTAPPLEVDVLEYDTGAITPVRHVYRLRPAKCATLVGVQALDGNYMPWWSMPDEVDATITHATAVEELRDLVVDAIRIREPAESCAVPLSGGLDSAIIAAVVDTPHAYTLTFPEADNMTAAGLAARDRDPVPVTFDRGMLEASLPDVLYHLDTPATWSASCWWYLCQAMADDGIRVLLSGEGADELFLGYSRYRILWHASKARHDPLLGAYGPTLDYMHDAGRMIGRMIDRGGNVDWAAAMVAPYISPAVPLATNAGRVEFHTSMQALLRMGDRMASAHSIENRCPFLDYRVIEFAARLPEWLTIDPRRSKGILRDVAQSLGVHPQIVHERTKKGMAIPFPQWYPEFADGARGAWDRKAWNAMQWDVWRRVWFGCK